MRLVRILEQCGYVLAYSKFLHIAFLTLKNENIWAGEIALLLRMRPALSEDSNWIRSTYVGPPGTSALWESDICVLREHQDVHIIKTKLMFLIRFAYAFVLFYAT